MNHEILVRQCLESPGWAAEQIRDLRAENERLHKLFDDAGQGEHNVLALVEHWQDEALKAQDENERLRTVLSKIARPGYGIELSDSDAEQAEYWANQCGRLRGLARAAIDGAEKDGE